MDPWLGGKRLGVFDLGLTDRLPGCALLRPPQPSRENKKYGAHNLIVISVRNGIELVLSF